LWQPAQPKQQTPTNPNKKQTQKGKAKDVEVHAKTPHYNKENKKILTTTNKGS
jgi:hypothetical protein